MRLGDYEVLRNNTWCCQIYKVMPEGYETKAKTRVAGDGRVLIGMECYPSTVAAAVRRIAQLQMLDGIDATEADGLALMLEEHERRTSGLADRIGAACAANPKAVGL